MNLPLPPVGNPAPPAEGVISSRPPAAARSFVHLFMGAVAVGTLLWWLEWQATLSTFPAVRPALQALADTKRQIREAREVCQRFEQEVARW